MKTYNFNLQFQNVMSAVDAIRNGRTPQNNDILCQLIELRERAKDKAEYYTLAITNAIKYVPVVVEVDAGRFRV